MLGARCRCEPFAYVRTIDNSGEAGGRIAAAPLIDSVERAIAAHNSPAYQEALAALGNTCERDMGIVEGVD
jgi:uncharacterized protein (DUF1330 family)